MDSTRGALQRLRWQTPEPAALADRLRRAGIEPRDDAFALGPLVVRLVAGPSDRLAVDDSGVEGVEGVGRVAPVPGWAALAIAWATVDLERVVAQLGAGPVDRRPRDATLGASVTLVPGRPITFAILEPDTEGRLAAMLARYGEGPVGVYVVRAGMRDAVFGDPGPFGPQRLLAVSASPWAPALLQVEPPRSGVDATATIRP